MNNIILTELQGGFGNQLFMIFNSLNLCHKYNCTPLFYQDSNQLNSYNKNNNVERKLSSKYKIFKKIDLVENTSNDLSNVEFTNFIEKEYKYNEIHLEKNKNYKILGYFQSYRYFFQSKEFIKNYLDIDYDLIEKLRKRFTKKTLAIHIRLTDYKNHSDIHPIPSLEYYKYSLSKYNLKNFEIILFSDDISEASAFLKPLNLKYTNADDIYSNDEEQFYMLMLMDVKICANSSFSLMASYVNDIFNFNKESYNIFPSKWFGVKGPNFNVNDFKLNYKYEFVNYNDFNLSRTLTKNYISSSPKILLYTTMYNKNIKGLKNFIKLSDKYTLVIFTNQIIYKFIKNNIENLPKNVIVIIKDLDKNFVKYDFFKDLKNNEKVDYIKFILLEEFKNNLNNFDYYCHCNICLFENNKNVNYNNIVFNKDILNKNKLTIVKTEKFNKNLINIYSKFKIDKIRNYYKKYNYPFNNNFFAIANNKIDIFINSYMNCFKIMLSKNINNNKIINTYLIATNYNNVKFINEYQDKLFLNL
jgi:hypothetical protein